ncbi:MAG TPA: 23S rRNA (adenine(2030)-N(6))-methyltransferase RlmJ [Caulobacteraceae bacterium]|jgi:23S rRNA (adenine2030-N6)-methyltransferase|nr:23S rRNA (adenine(2030)-N(6))-methyltransferase RlmJ [Caulobacteraceae bacterium]
MNYRHAFHAGNHADVFKHAALGLVLEWLLQKPAPFAVLDTHAGIGVYDLGAGEAQRTLEYEAGVSKVFGAGLASAPGYSSLLREMNPEALATYPGSPEIVRRMLRAEDRLIACELHPADVETLRSRYRSDGRVSVHHRDGYEAIGALLPPKARRGLVLIDPPFEQPGEAERLAAALAVGLRKWPNGTFMAWYPIVDGLAGAALARAAVAGGFPKALRAEFAPYPRDGVSLAGGGLLIANAPWRLDERLTALCQELAGRLGDGGGWSVDWLTQP